MFEHCGIWLPDGEQHLTGMLDGAPRDPDDGRGTYQLRKLNAAMAYVPADRRRRAVDVGAHAGLWTLQLQKRFAEVEAFEPMPAHRECWERNVLQCADPVGNAELWPLALGAAPGNVSLFSNPASSGDTYVVESGGVSDSPVRPLDCFEFVDVDFLKIDCEGYELLVCHGAEQTLRRCRPVVIVEQKPGRAQKYGFGETEAVTWLDSLGAVLRQTISGDYIMSWPDDPSAGASP